MKEDQTFRKIISKKYADSPELVEEILKHEDEIDIYMTDDTIPPVFKGQRKSRLDLDDNGLSIKMSKYDFIKACINGDLDTVKKIVNRYKEPTKSEIINHRDQTGRSGYDYSCLYIYPELENYLLKNGAVETEKTKEIKQMAENRKQELTKKHLESVLDY